MSDETARSGFARALANRNLRIYWIGNSASVVGFWVHRMALGWLTWQLTESPTWLGAIGFCSLIPSVVLSPIAGAVGDRWGLRRVAAMALVTMGILGAVLAATTLAGVMSIEGLLVLTILIGVAAPFDLANRQALVPSIVTRDDLPSAIALNSTTFHAGGFVGPALFGVLFPFIGVSGAFTISAVGYFMFAGMLFVMRLDHESTPRAHGGGLFDDLIEGFKYVAAERGVLTVFMVSALGHLLIRPYVDMLPAFSADVFGRGAEGLGMLQAMTGLGALAAGIWLMARSGRGGLARVLAASSFGAMACMVLFALTPRFEVGLGFLLLLGFALLSNAVCSQALVQSYVTSAVRGRVVSLSVGMAVGFPAIGAMLLGSLGSVFGVQAPVAGAALLGLVLWLFLVRRLVRLGAAMENQR